MAAGYEPGAAHLPRWSIGRACGCPSRLAAGAAAHRSLPGPARWRRPVPARWGVSTLTGDGSLRPGGDARPPPPRAVRRPGDRWGHHRGGHGPRRRLPGPEDRPRRAGRLRLRHLVQELQADPRRAALPPAGRRPPRLRGAGRAPAAPPQRPPPGQDPALHDPDPHPRRGHERQAGPGLRLGAVDVRPDRRRPDRQAPPPAQEGRGAGPHADAAGRAAGLRLPVLRRPGRRRPALPDRRPHRRRARGRRAQRRDGGRPAQGARPDHRRAGRRRRRRGGRRRDRCRERRGGLGRRGPRPRRGHQSRTPSARPRGSTSPSRGRRSATTSPS